MKKLNPVTGSSPFPTKKKSFDPSWGTRATWAALLGVGIAASSAFTAVMVLLMAPQKVRFLNVRASNLPDLRTAPFPGEVEVTQDTPLLFFGKDDVVFGTVGSVIAPRRGGGPQGGESVVIVPRTRWRADLALEAKRLAGATHPRAPSAFVIGFDARLDDEGDLRLVREVAAFASALDAHKDAGTPRTAPNLVFARVPGTPTSTSWNRQE